MNILFFSNDGKLGDAVLHTSLVKGIKDSYPDANIYCTTAGSTTEFWQRDPRITESWYLWKLSFWQIIKLGLAIRKKKIDYIISWNPIKAEKLKLLCWLINPKHGVKVFVVKPHEHASIKEQRVLEMLGCKETKVRYNITPTKVEYTWNENSIYLNIFASIESRTIQHSDAVKLLDLLAEKFPTRTVYLTYVEQNKNRVDALIEQTKNKHVIGVDCSNNLEKLLSLCEHTSLVISPDTAIVHIASAFNKTIIALFEKDNMLLQTNWAPISDRYTIINFFKEHNREEVMVLVIDTIVNNNF
ncbi:glycosyltransferase family 9 protein [Zophobihabitans entericus]|uniref:Glycosyltransferase family 9 protein n=1 Tax=Zophobihabitans entericus TaxID=1635327 RepID=A0A6G9IAE7_9GAMM|nr:glycosyltransferase family 9 protein [Zophobihabitans entericus]QIQ21208.1 glycosyltransferase family 9 protein [Zophobihabitans entericus]